MSLRTADARARENQAKFIQQRINNVEKHFADLCQQFSAYSRKVARVRDKGDVLAKSVLTYAGSEASSTKSGLTGFAEKLSSVSDYRQAMVDRLSQRVVHPLTLYGQNFKHTREDMKATFAARTKEINEQKKLENIRKKNPNNRQQIAQAESKLQRANVDASRTSRNLEDQMDSFERKRLQDLKSILSEFVKIEMLFHSKALEVYTEAWQHLHAISDEDDLEEFRNSLRPFNATTGSTSSNLANSRTSLNSTDRSNKPTAASFTSSSRQKHGKDRLDTSRIVDMEEDDEDEDDEEDDDEYDDEDDESQ
ncbi:protein FAM92A-like isoform X1 [Patiria miniata]|uniref:Protein FAM92A1 n=1 Tax=Patiria miniata TaxID=46514 RepID=A0A914AXS1_PATMI|nr:protein FAM92A-like isoform X1 [Patiria miniata]